MTALVACTIVPNRGLAGARVLAEAVLTHHPAAKVVVLFADGPDLHATPGPERFEAVRLDALGLPDLAGFCFRHDRDELVAALRPRFLRHLVERAGAGAVLALEADVLVCGELSALTAALDDHAIALLPYRTAPVGDEAADAGGRAGMVEGLYDPGCLGVKAGPAAGAFLEWWAERPVDDRALDAVPALFPAVHVERDPGYGLAAWNLAQRPVERRDTVVTAAGRPLRLLHLGGLDPDFPAQRPAPAPSPEEVWPLEPLIAGYRARLLAAGHVESRHRPYGFDHFDNGVRIPAIARRLHASLGSGARRFGDPFRTGGRSSFWRWLNEDAVPGSGISRLWYHLYVSHGEVQRDFPDLFGADRVRYLEWARERARLLFGIDGAFGPEGDRIAAPAPRPGSGGRAELGLNVAGYAMSEKGVGEALRATVRALVAADVPHCVVDFPDEGSANRDRTLVGLVKHNPYPVNLIHVNADQLPHFVYVRGARFLKGKYNIGFWMWELPDLPPSHDAAFAYLDEVWVASTFCLEAVARVSPVPVVKIPLTLPEAGLATRSVGRAHFGLPAEAFVFLFVFDVHSVLERKNPLGLVRAFRAAFPSHEDVRLVLKCVHGTARTRELLAAAAGDARVVVIDRVMERAELNSLIEACDCYVSLHRSEGFGLTMAEAMALGKPVIATGYSANLDFMTLANSFLVRWDPITLADDQGPYQRGSIWADPDLEHAAELMRSVYAHPDRARAVGQRAAKDIWRYMGARDVGERIARRLDVIARRLDAPPPGRPAGP